MFPSVSFVRQKLPGIHVSLCSFGRNVEVRFIINPLTLLKGGTGGKGTSTANVLYCSWAISHMILFPTFD